MSELDEAIGWAVDRAWNDFLKDMDRRYPAEEWPADRLRGRRDVLLEGAEGAGGRDGRGRNRRGQGSRRDARRGASDRGGAGGAR